MNRNKTLLTLSLLFLLALPAVGLLWDARSGNAGTGTEPPIATIVALGLARTDRPACAHRTVSLSASAGVPAWACGLQHGEKRIERIESQRKGEQKGEEGQP